MNQILILFLICIYFGKCYGQCDNDKHFKYYHTLIENEKDNIQKVFDGILEKYGDIGKILEDLLNKLHKDFDNADRELNQLEKYNEDINGTNNDSNSKLSYILKDLHNIEDELKQIKFDKSWPHEKENADNSANKAVSRPESSDIAEQEAELAKWKKFLEQPDEYNFAKDIMNLPHSVSDKLTLLEELLTKGSTTDCVDKFHNDLKLLYIELASLFNMSIFKEDVDNLNSKASQNKKDANKVLSDTESFLEKEKKLKDVYHLTNDTLALAEELEKLKRMINELSGNNEEIINDRLKKLQEEHEAEIQTLREKYSVEEGEALLDKLKTTKDQIENINMGDLEKDIENYSREIDCYLYALEECKKGNDTTSSCETTK